MADCRDCAEPLGRLDEVPQGVREAVAAAEESRTHSDTLDGT